MYTTVAIRRSLEDFCKARDQALEQFASAYRLIDSGFSGLETICHHIKPYDASPRLTLAELTREIDRRLWRRAFDLTGLRQVMDSKAIREFDTSLEKSPPTFTMDNAQSALLSAFSDSEMMFSRGLVEVFSTLEGRFKTNDAFKLSPKFILSRVFEAWPGSALHVCYSSYSGGRLNDLDRVCRSLRGEKHEPRSLETAINGALKACHEAGETPTFQNDLYKVNAFRNGNAHVWLLDQTVVDKANTVISEYFDGSALPDARSTTVA